MRQPLNGHPPAMNGVDDEEQLNFEDAEMARRFYEAAHLLGMEVEPPENDLDYVQETFERARNFFTQV